MIELIALVLLSIHIGKLAEKKGENKNRWIFSMVVNWILFEFTAMMIMIWLLRIDTQNMNKMQMLQIMLIGLFAGFGSYLLTRYRLEQRPDAGQADDESNINN